MTFHDDAGGGALSGEPPLASSPFPSPTWRRVLRVDSPGFTTGLLALGSAGAIAICAATDPDTMAEGPVLCPFRRLTGLSCPACGLTRSWTALLHGDVAGSLTFHPVGWAVLALAVLVIAVAVIAVVTRRAVPSFGEVVRPRVAYAVVGATVVFGAIRLVTELT